MSGRSTFHISAWKEVYLNTLSNSGGAVADVNLSIKGLYELKQQKTTVLSNQVDLKMFGCYDNKPQATGKSDSCF